MNDCNAHWTAFAAAPHRFFFFTGLFFMILISAWWLFVLIARSSTGLMLEPVLPGVFMHGSVMLFLVFPPFMFGFLLTVYPRWQPAPEIPKAVQAVAFALLHIAAPLILVGMYSVPEILVAGWLLAALAWLAILGALVWSWRQCRAPVIHATVVVVGLFAGLVGISLLVAMLAFDAYSLWPWIKAIGLWGFLLVVYIAVCHRMIPFFTSRVVRNYEIWRPDWMLWTFVSMALLRAGLETSTSLRWIPDLVMLSIAAMFAWRWRPQEPHGVKLLSVLHVSFAWLVVAMLLYSINDVGVAWTGKAVIGRAPLHALGMGFFGGMLIAMVTRVTMGHSGRPLEMDRKGWWIFLLVQLAAGLRIIADVVGDLVGDIVPVASQWLFVCAASAWFSAFLAWSWRYGSIHFRPRVDGQPG